MGIFRGSTPQILQDLGVSGIEYQVTVTITPDQVRSLNASPVNLAVPANANTILVPGQVMFVGAQGSETYSSSITSTLQYSDASFTCSLDGDSWDGSAATFSVVPDAMLLMAGQFDPDELTSQLGLSLQYTNTDSDVTGGDASCTIILTYMSYDLTGLL